MMMPELNDLKKLCNAEDIVSIKMENGTVFLLFFPYSPYCDFPEGHLYFDAYYIASNDSYQSVKQACEKLKEQSLQAWLDNEFNFKKAACASGKAIIGKNGLAIHHTFGSYFVMQAIFVAGIFLEDTKPLFNQFECDSCNLCVNACPTGALTSYDFSCCIRNIQDEATMESLKYIGECVLGCTVCRKSCPHNAHIPCISSPSEIMQISNIKTLLEYSKHTELLLKKYLGANLARKKYIIPSAICAALQNKAPYLPEYLEKWRTSELVSIKNAIAYAERFLD